MPKLFTVKDSTVTSKSSMRISWAQFGCGLLRIVDLTSKGPKVVPSLFTHVCISRKIYFNVVTHFFLS